MAKRKTRVKGTQQVKRRSAQMAASFAGACEEGMLEMGEDLRKRAEFQTPVHKGALRASMFTYLIKNAKRIAVVVGYTSPYAVAVHEKTEMKLQGQPRKGKDATGFYWDPQGEAKAKFLEDPASDMGAAFKVFRERMKRAKLKVSRS